MGIVLLPFFIAALAIFVFSAFNVFKLAKLGMVSTRDWLEGLGIFALLYATILVSYYGKTSAWAFSPLFQVVLTLFCLPFLVRWIVKRSGWAHADRAAKLLSIGIVWAGILGIIHHQFYFDLLQMLGVSEHF